MQKSAKNDEENLIFFDKLAITSRDSPPEDKKTDSFNENLEKNDEIFSMDTNPKKSGKAKEKPAKNPEFANKPLNFPDKVRKALELRYSEQEELINAVLSFVESGKIKENRQFFLWFLCYFLYIEPNALLSDILTLYRSQLSEIWSISTKFSMNAILEPKDLEAEFHRRNPLLIGNILDFFIENEVFLPFLPRTLRKMRFALSAIPRGTLQKIIQQEKHYLLNSLINYRDRAEEIHCVKEVKHQKNRKLVQEMLVFHMQKENNNNKQEMLHSLISIFLQERLPKLLSIFLHFSRKSIKKPALTIDALESNCPHFLFKCLKFYRKYPMILLKEPVFLALTQALNKPSLVEEAIWMLFETRNYAKSFSNLHVKLLVDKIEQIFKNESVNLLSYCVFPIGALVLIIELLRLLSRKKRSQSLRILNLSAKLLELTMIYLKEVNEISILHHILCKSFMKNQKKLKILDIFMGDPLFYKEILATDFMTNILKNQLSAGFQYDFNLLVASTSYQYLSAGFSLRHDSRKKIANFANSAENAEKRKESFASYSIKIVDGNVFNYIRKPEISDTNLTNHLYSYLMFTRNINLRLFIAFVFFSVTTALLYNDIYLASQLSSNVSNVNKDIINYMADFTLPSKYKEQILVNLAILPEIDRKTNVLYQKYIVKSTAWSNPYSKLSIKEVNPEEICHILFIVLTNTQEMSEYIEECVLSAASFMQFSNDLSTFIAVVCLILIISSEIYVSKVYMHLKGYSPAYFSLRAVIYELSFMFAIVLLVFMVRLQNSFNGFSIVDWIWDISFINLLLNCQLVFLMLIFFFYLSNLEKFGRIVKMIVLVIQQLSKFFFVLAITLLYAALVFYMIFSGELEEFHLFFDCIKIALEGFLGSFAFIEEEQGTAIYAYFVLFALYLLLCNAVFLNLIIAVLNNTYNKFHELGSIFQSLQIYEVNKTHGFDKRYSAMISSPPPFNFISIISGFFLITFRSEKLNDVLLKSSFYFFSFIPSCILFLLCNLALIPFAWVYILSLLVLNNYKTFDGFKYEVNGRVTITHMLGWCLGGLPYLMWNLFNNDLGVYARSCFINVDNRSLLKPISKTDWTILKKIAREYVRKGEKTVDSMDFSNNLIEKYMVFGDKNVNSAKIKDTITGLRRITSKMVRKLGDVESENFATEKSIKIQEKDEEGISALQIFKEKYKAQNLFYRFVVNEKIDVVKMSVLIQKLKKIKGKGKETGGMKKAYFLINLIALNEFWEALKKWRKEENEEIRILKSFEY